jgi:phospholipase C
MQPDPIKHIIVLMFENHSFDQMLGGMRAEIPDLDGADPAAPHGNSDSEGMVYSQGETTALSVSPDPKHETKNVLLQLDSNNGNFVRDYAAAYPDTTQKQRQEIMGYYPAGALPALHELARNFAVCDRWFSSVPGPTWANRFFIHSGTSMGRVIMPDGPGHPSLVFGYDQDTVYDRLNEKGILWKVYFGDIPLSLVMSHQRRLGNARRHHRMSAFYSDAAGPEHQFPAYSFIEPSYFRPGQNDDHPPHPTGRAQLLLANVYNALRANEPLWNTTLLVVLYDEHGGFYDHVAPPAAVPPDAHIAEYSFDRLGVRVPALLVSPWVSPGVVRTEFDHTSLLNYVTDKWGLGPLTARVAQANSFAAAIRTVGEPRTDTPAALPVPVPPLALAAAEVAVAEPTEPLNEHQKALLAFTDLLENEIQEPAPLKAMRSLAMNTGSALTRVETAKNRVESFLAQRRLP